MTVNTNKKLTLEERQAIIDKIAFLKKEEEIIYKTIEDIKKELGKDQKENICTNLSNQIEKNKKKLTRQEEEVFVYVPQKKDHGPVKEKTPEKKTLEDTLNEKIPEMSKKLVQKAKEVFNNKTVKNKEEIIKKTKDPKKRKFLEELRKMAVILGITAWLVTGIYKYEKQDAKDSMNEKTKKEIEKIEQKNQTKIDDKTIIIDRKKPNIDTISTKIIEQNTQTTDKTTTQITDKFKTTLSKNLWEDEMVTNVHAGQIALEVKRVQWEIGKYKVQPTRYSIQRKNEGYDEKQVGYNKIQTINFEIKRNGTEIGIIKFDRQGKLITTELEKNNTSYTISQIWTTININEGQFASN